MGAVIDSVPLLERVHFEIIYVESFGSSMLPDVDHLVVIDLALVVHTEDAVQFVLVHQFVQTSQHQLITFVQLS